MTTDADGRFNLNALHKASGEGMGKRPQYWLNRQQTEELIAEIKSRDSGLYPISIQQGRSGGTFAVEQLAVAYANWISPRFYLQVIDVFLAYRKGELQPITKVSAQVPT
ncbi:KilA-N domain-containing protein [Sedimenticola selenatireducens]|uniref:KilA-N domain-containing protein n=1 Tax=Sedimenticola selenatireducens TaxID=191960 RepID=UPI0023550D3E|nr:KilA-N domain-containing protein [Sedimenticola selenatireducens]